MQLVEAQQARRILDRLVGYKLSPFLWKKVMKKLSAGRVQSVALRLIVEREEEIKKFKPEEYWSITTRLATDSKKEFEARLYKKANSALQKMEIKKENEAQTIITDLEKSNFIISDIRKSDTEKQPLPPFTTSTLQQEAAARFGFSAKETMYIAQSLYEGVKTKSEEAGLITYMRTDSVNVSEKAKMSALEFIKKEFGDTYVQKGGRIFKTKSKVAQEAHEAIRPTDVHKTPDSLKEYLNKKQSRLYKLIWQRFVATQMSPAKLLAVTVDIETRGVSNVPYVFRATGQTIQFDGFLRVYPSKTQEVLLPTLEPEQKLTCRAIHKNQHFTQPPARFSESTLIKTLEEYDIGRPSTYAPTLSTLFVRGYIIKNEQKRLTPTEVGIIVNQIITEHFPTIVDATFTAQMENMLDQIAIGKRNAPTMLRDFYEPFNKLLEEKYQTVEKKDMSEPTDKICPKCNKPMVIKYGRFGKFFACSGFPDCKHTESLPPPMLDIKCTTCSTGNVIIKRTKTRRMFYGCSRYPDCTFALWQKPTGVMCPTCGKPLVEMAKNIKCSNKECGYKTDKQP